MLKPLPALVFLSATLAAQDPSLETLRQEGRWKQVRVRIDGWYRSSPQDPNALLWMSRVKQAFGEREAALDLARKAAALQGNNADIQAQLAAMAGMSAGAADGMLKQYAFAKEMKKAGEAALALQPDHEEAVEMMMAFYLQAPAIVGGGEAKAKALIQKVALTRPVAALVMQANLAHKQKDRTAALGYVRQALAREPRSYEALMALAASHLVVKPQELDAALGVYRQAAAAHPKEPMAQAQIAAILAEQGKWVELEAALAESRRLLPDNLVPYYSAGRNLMDENKDLDRAERLLRVYLSQPPEGGMPDLAKAHQVLGQVREKQGRKAEAIAELELALKLRPDFKAAKKDLERLRKG